MSETDEKALVAQILSSYLLNNTVAPADLPSVIESVKRAFASTSETMPTSTSEFEKLGGRCQHKKVGYTRGRCVSRLR